MRPYVNDYISTLSGQRQERAADLLEEARVGKERLDALAARIAEEFLEFAPTVLAKISPESRIQADQFRQTSRQLALRLHDLFTLSNMISILLNSHAAVLASDVKAIEDELIALEKMAFNYAFLLSDNQAYNYAHLDTFSDESNKEENLQTIPDRSPSRIFGPAEQAEVNAAEGVLVLAEDQLVSHGLVGRIVDGNAIGFTVEDTGIHNVFRGGSTRGWKYTMAAAASVKAPMLGTVENGAQMLTEFTLTAPSISSKINITPFADMPVNLLKVIAYANEDDTVGEQLLAHPVALDRPYSLQFPTRKIQRFQLLLNQPTYVRVDKMQKMTEEEYRQIVRSYHAKQYVKTARRIRKSLDKLMVSNKKRKYPKGIYAFRTPELKKVTRGRKAGLWKRNSKKSRIMRDLMSQMAKLQRFENTLFRRSAIHLDPLPERIADDIDRNKVVSTGFQYHYTIGLMRVAIGNAVPGFKGVYVSKPMDAPGDIGEVRLKTAQENYELPISDRHSRQVTSVEYSVSNRAYPHSEVDWTPILPVGTDQVVGERVFVANGRAELRFIANPSDSLYLYKNGYNTNITPTDYEYAPGGGIAALKIGTANAADIYTVDYYPVTTRDHTTVQFDAEGDIPLVSSYDSEGAGEHFLSTGDRNTVDLQHVAYVDVDSVDVIGYAPIVVKLDSGLVAENLTDYTGTTTVSLPEDGYYYIHSGSTLMFNKPILEPFRVYYQYLENNVRVRVVLRSNSTDFATPKVDFYHLKAKSRQVE